MLGRRRRWKNGGEFECFQLFPYPLDFHNQGVNLGEDLGLVINLGSVSVHLLFKGDKNRTLNDCEGRLVFGQLHLCLLGFLNRLGWLILRHRRRRRW